MNLSLYWIKEVITNEFSVRDSIDSPAIYLKVIKPAENRNSSLELWPVFDLFLAVGGVNMH